MKTYDVNVEVKAAFTLRIQAEDEFAARDLVNAFFGRPRELSSIVKVTGRRPFDVILVGEPVEVSAT